MAFPTHHVTSSPLAFKIVELLLMVKSTIFFAFAFALLFFFRTKLPLEYFRRPTLSRRRLPPPPS
jgi:hypothetical protein